MQDSIIGANFARPHKGSSSNRARDHGGMVRQPECAAGLWNARHTARHAGSDVDKGAPRRVRKSEDALSQAGEKDPAPGIEKTERIAEQAYLHEFPMIAASQGDV